MLKLRRGVILLTIGLSVCLMLLGCAGPAPTATSELPDTAEFEISSLLVQPTEVVAGEAISIEAVVTKVGKTEGAFLATLKVDEVVVEKVFRDFGLSFPATLGPSQPDGG